MLIAVGGEECEKTTRLRQLLQQQEILVAPGAHDVLTAKIIEKVGFEAVYFTGYGQAASHLGTPDIGLLTMTEMVARVRNFVCALDIPVIADGDTGFGNAVNVMRTVREYEAAGAAAIQLEDQVAPKKCGHMTGRQVVSVEEMAGKIKAAVAARQDPDMVIIARTDARTALGIEEAVSRGKAYEAAGADVLFIESPGKYCRNAADYSQLPDSGTGQYGRGRTYTANECAGVAGNWLSTGYFPDCFHVYYGPGHL